MNTQKEHIPQRERVRDWAKQNKITWALYRFALIPLVAFTAIGTVIYLVASVQGRFIVGPDWVEGIAPFDMVLATFSSLVVTLFVWNAPQLESKPSLSDKLARPLFPLVWFGLMLLAIRFPIPYIFALTSSVEHEFIFTVQSAGGYGDRKCRNPIYVDDLPALGNKLCDFPSDFTARFAKGDQIAVTGHGTQWGVLVTSAQKVE